MPDEVPVDAFLMPLLLIPSQRLFDASYQEENRDLLDAKKKFSWGSQKTPHPCTDQAQCCLTLVINSIFGCAFGY